MLRDRILCKAKRQGFFTVEILFLMELNSDPLFFIVNKKRKVKKVTFRFHNLCFLFKFVLNSEYVGGDRRRILILKFHTKISFGEIVEKRIPEEISYYFISRKRSFVEKES